MALDGGTVAAIRFGYGFHRDQPVPGNAAGLMDAVEAGAAAGLSFPIRGLSERRSQLDDLIAERKTNGKTAAFQKMRKHLERHGSEVHNLLA